MAKQIKRFGPYAGAVTILVLILLLAPLAQPDPLGTRPGIRSWAGWPARTGRREDGALR